MMKLTLSLDLVNGSQSQVSHLFTGIHFISPKSLHDDVAYI